MKGIRRIKANLRWDAEALAATAHALAAFSGAPLQFVDLRECATADKELDAAMRELETNRRA